MDQWAGVVLAAGLGMRMKSGVPKVLHRVCGKEMIRYPVELLQQLGIKRTVVVVSPTNASAVQGLLGSTVEYVTQSTPNGTGDALSCAAELLGEEDGYLLVLGADSPLILCETLKALMQSHLDQGCSMSLLTADVSSVGDAGRVLRDQSGRIEEIVEAAQRTENSDLPGEVNGGVYCFSAPWLWEHLERIQPAVGGERYLTALAAAAQGRVHGMVVADASELQGVNNRLQLAAAEALQRQRIRDHWMLAGVTMLDPASTYIDADVTIGQDTVLLPNTMLLGKTDIGEACEIGPGSTVRDSSVGSGVRVTASMLEEAVMESDTDIGPFSHLRPGAYLESGVHVGNFVEVKESRLSSGVAMGHFGYVGDAFVGANTNLGAGMITCNYDGKDKHRTVIEAGAFIGCDTMLVAPVTVGAAAATGAGSVVTRNVPPGRLAVGVPAKIKARKMPTD